MQFLNEQIDLGWRSQHTLLCSSICICQRSTCQELHGAELMEEVQDWSIHSRMQPHVLLRLFVPPCVFFGLRISLGTQARLRVRMKFAPNFLLKFRQMLRDQELFPVTEARECPHVACVCLVWRKKKTKE